MLKKTVSIIIGSLLLFLLLSACGNTPKQAIVPGKVNVVTTFYTLYDFTNKIGGSHVNVINLVPAGVEPHDWTPKSNDIINITKAQLFVYNGAGFEGWVPDMLNNLKDTMKATPVEASKNVQFLKLSGADAGSGKGTESEIDPHTWLSPKNAMLIAANIKDALTAADPANSADYEANYKKLASDLNDLDRSFQSALSAVPHKEIVVSHEAFGYLARDYGLKQIAIMGLSPDAEPTAQEMKSIAQFVRDHHVKTIFFEELVSDKLAKTLAAETGVGTTVLNPLEGLTEKDMAEGQDYLSVMAKNLKNLVEALQ